MASGWPSTTAATGTGSRSAVSTGIRSARPRRTTTAIRAPTPSSAAAMSSASRKASAPTAEVVTTGPSRAEPGGSSPRSRSRVPAPVLATAAGFGAGVGGQGAHPAAADHDGNGTLPAGTGWDAIRVAASSSSPKLAVAMMPACSNSACRVISGAAAIAVCETTARCRGANRPAWTVRMGTLAPTRRAVRANLVAEGFKVQNCQLGGVVGFAPHEHVGARDVQLAAERRERGDPDTQPGELLEEHRAHPAGLDDHADAAGRRVARDGGRGRQPDTRYLNAAGGRAHQPHASAPGDLQQAGFLRRRQGRGRHHQRPDAAVSPHSLAPPRRVSPAPSSTARSGGSGSAATDGTHGMPFDFTSARADREQRAAEAGVADAEQDGPAGRILSGGARADHRDRPGRQQRLQAGTSACLSRPATASR